MIIEIGSEIHWSLRLMNNIFVIFMTGCAAPTVFSPSQSFYTETVCWII